MKYTTTHKVFHWISAILVLGMLGTGLAYSYDLGDKGTITAHQIMGQILVLVLAGRIVARLIQRTTAVQTSHNAFEKGASVTVHLALYACMIALVVTGYVSASALGDNALLAPVDLVFARSDTGETLLDFHYLLKWVLLGLLGLHIAAAFKHALWDKDDTLRQITFKP